MQTEATGYIAAAKAGMDEKTARKYVKSGKLPSEFLKEHNWRTRTDPFEAHWEEVREKLAESPGLEAKTHFEDLQRRFPGTFADGQLRTLQRRVKRWRALEVRRRKYFSRNYTPRRAGPVRLHTHGQARHHHREAAVRSPHLSLHTHLLKLGNRQYLLLRELRKPQ
ncbi:hypothetical protein GHYDROH2_23030 [Geobacter hydrogenophilus]|uniref:Transposase n=1 Tax=Geobacter hydrogenophilus TaxID=40983 RepID=A0A9W6LCD7_9BACT|nr:hypothetical protein GHYDROH2_23030 [Geobacter hydrogenophilus]